MKRIKVLITGSTGFIGTNLKKSLKEYNVKDWDLDVGNDIFNFDFEDAVSRADVVVHLAAKTSVNESFKNPGETYRVNVLGTARVAELCVKYKKKLIFPSSAAIYHPELSPYADSKLIAEHIVLSINDLIPVVVFRLFNVYGDNMNPRTGSVMYNFLHADKLIVFGDGEQTRDFINVKDVVTLIKDAIKHKKWNGQVVDVGTGQAYTTNFIAGLFAYYRNKEIVYEKPRREIKWSIADIKNLCSLYRKPLQTSISDDIKNLCKQV